MQAFKNDALEERERRMAQEESFKLLQVYICDFKNIEKKGILRRKEYKKRFHHTTRGMNILKKRTQHLLIR